jgi:hypothetical protein
MSKNAKRIMVILAVALIVFSVTAFAFPFKRNGMFWMSYVFGVLAIVMQLYVCKVAFQGTDTVKSKFYGFPVAQIGIIYMAVQLVLSLIFMVLATITPVWIALVLYVLLMGIAVIGFIAADASRDEMERQDVKIQTGTSCMTTLRSLVYTLMEQCDNPESKKQLGKLADEFQYSDPVSSEALKEIEQELENLVSQIQIAVCNHDEDISTLVLKTQNTLAARNRLCKLNKHR